MTLIVQSDHLSSCSPVMVRIIVGGVDSEPGWIDAGEMTLIHVDVVLQKLLAHPEGDPFRKGDDLVRRASVVRKPREVAGLAVNSDIAQRPCDPDLLGFCLWL